MSEVRPDSVVTTAPSATVEPRRLSAGFIVIYVLAIFAIWMSINLPASVTMALRVSEIDPDNQTNTYSLVAGVGTLVALIANPLFGRLSDRTRSRFGRRRPWILIGLVGTAIGAAVIGLSDTIGLLILGWVLMQAFVNAAIAACLAIVGDRVPGTQQGLVGSLTGMASALSIVVGVVFIRAFPTSILAQVGLPVALAIVLAVALVFVFRDDTPAPADRPAFSVREFLGSFYVNPRAARDFSWFLIAFFLLNIGYGVVSTYAVYYLQEHLGVGGEELTNDIFFAYLLTGAVTIVASPLAGWLSDRIGRRKPIFVAAAVFLALGIGIIVTASDSTTFIVGQTVAAGLGAGILFGVYISFAVATLKDVSTVGRDLGIVNIAFTLPFSVVPFAAPLALAIGGGGANYPALYILGGIITLLSIPALAGIRSTR